MSHTNNRFCHFSHVETAAAGFVLLRNVIAEIVWT